MKIQDTIAFIICIILVASTMFILGIIVGYTNSPDLLDVYRGNTELKITYTIVNNDTINCDSIVVLKK